MGQKKKKLSIEYVCEKYQDLMHEIFVSLGPNVKKTFIEATPHGDTETLLAFYIERSKSEFLMLEHFICDYGFSQPYWPGDRDESGHFGFEGKFAMRFRSGSHWNCSDTLTDNLIQGDWIPFSDIDSWCQEFEKIKEMAKKVEVAIKGWVNTGILSWDYPVHDEFLRDIDPRY